MCTTSAPRGMASCDDTSAFIRALELGRSGKGTREKKPANVYVPSGTYLVSDTLIVYRATMLAGDADHPPTLVLKKNSHLPKANRWLFQAFSSALVSPG